jgi:glycosyltransferase involved in cell wall biosynthesis
VSGPLRVLLDVSAVPARPVGAGVYTIALAHGLAAHPDIDLHLLARTDDEARWAEVAPGANTHPMAPSRRPPRLAWEQTFAPKLARRIGAALWHGPHYTMPLRLDVPAVVTVHDLTFFDHPEWHERSKVVFFRRMIRASAHRAAAIVCVSAFTAGRLREVAPAEGNVVVVPHGVDHERFDPQPRADDDAQLAAHGVREPFVVFVGTLEPRKNVPALVRAFATVARARPELRLVLAGGDGWGSDAVRDAISASKVSTRIVRAGYVSDAAVSALYRRAAVVAYPSFEEGFGLPALEALACGAPLVTSTGSALEEVVGDAALTVAPNDVDALAAAIGTLLDDGARVAHLREAGPRRAATFTWEAAVDAHVETYHNVALTRTGS